MADDLARAPLTGLYDIDFYAWTQEQAALLLAMARGENVTALDWVRLAEEVGDMGKRDLRSVRSSVARIIEHLLKLHWSRQDEPKAGWRAEIARFRIEVQDQLTPSIRRLIEDDLGALHARGAILANIALEQHEPDTPTPDAPNWSLSEILDEA
jgi:hypothetical protein